MIYLSHLFPLLFLSGKRSVFNEAAPTAQNKLLHTLPPFKHNNRGAAAKLEKQGWNTVFNSRISEAYFQGMNISGSPTIRYQAHSRVCLCAEVHCQRFTHLAILMPQSFAVFALLKITRFNSTLVKDG